jgi:hypothetical protein
VLDDAHALASLRDAVEPEHLDRLARVCLAHPVAHEVLHGPDPSPVRAGDDRVAHLERAATDQDRDHRPPARIEL